MMRNKQQPPPPPKPRKDHRHWSQQIQESVVSSTHEDSLNIIVKGGADSGLFCFVGDVNHDHISYHGQKLYTEDTILEIQGQKISGYTLRDATLWLKQVSQNGAPVMIKTLRPGLLPRELRQFLTARFQKGSVDHDLQQTIRDNLYMRTVPCTTRPPRPGESNGVDYTFLSLEEFYELEKTGDLLESGIFDGNHYGTPRPPKEPQPNALMRRPTPGGNMAGSPGDTKRKRNNSSSEAVQSNDYSDELPLPPLTRKKSLERAHSSSNLGPLPSNWEMAFTDEGQPYFIDHDTETTHWLDPRLAKVKKDSDSGEDLPYGWEKVEDPHFGTYFIDHVHRKTQYENPVISGKHNSSSGQDSPGGELNGNSTLPRQSKGNEGTKRSVSDSDMNNKMKPGLEGRRPRFTKNVAELKGDLLQTSLVKSIRGFGFTIIGADEEDEEFLQVKNIVPNGPAYLDGKLRTGDVLVYINNSCVLGYTHQNVVSVFQSIPPGETVTLDVCRGYALPSNLDDPNTEIVRKLAVNAPEHGHYNHPPPYGVNGLDPLNTSQRSLKSLPDLAKSHNANPDISFSQQSIQGDLINNEEPPDLISNKIEMLTVNIVRGQSGFGFTIADSPYGQRVKQILDRPRCKNLLEGDILHHINEINVRDMTHAEIVGVLKECPVGSDTKIVIQRGGVPFHIKGRKPVKPSRSFDEKPRDGIIQPGAYFFNEANSHNHAEKSDESFASSNPPLSQGENDRLNELSTVQESPDEVDSGMRGKIPNDVNRPKTPILNDSRPKTPTMNDNRPKTPTRFQGSLVDNRTKPPVASRPVFSDVQNRYNGDNVHDNSNHHEFNHSRSDFHNSGNYDSNSRPPPGPRVDQFRHIDYGSHPIPHQNFRNDPYGYARSNNYAMQNDGDRRELERENIKPGQFRSRTPGPDMLNRGYGPDYRPEHSRPKTPTANDMRSKTPTPGMSSNHSGFKPSGRFTPNPAWEYGQQYRHDYNRPIRPGDSPNIGRRFNHDHTDSHERSYGNDFTRSFQAVGNNSPLPSRQKHSTSFEGEEISRVPKRYGTLHSGNQYGVSPYGPLTRIPDQEDGQQYREMTVHLPRHESGFGFRIIGGTEEGSQVSVGFIVPGGASDQEGQLRQGDEIMFVDQNCVINSTHRRVVQLMGHASLNGHVTITARRRLTSAPDVTSHTTGGQTYPYDVTVTRRENEGFGFVIISSVTKSGSTIGRILENSPAERCNRLHVGDRILAVNGVNISQIHHEDIVNLIKESGYSVTLTIGPPPDDASSTASASQKSSQGSMVNAMAYPAVSETDVGRRPEAPNTHQTWDNRYKTAQEANRARFNNTPLGMKAAIYHVELDRGSRGFGFSIRGGREFNNMPLFVLRIAEGGAADVDGRLRVGDQILEINQIETSNMTHSEAIDIIQNGGTIVRLKMKRTNKPPPVFEGAPSPTGPYPRGAISNGPIGHSSPHLGRRQLEEYPTYPSGRAFVNY
ncbi:membrane-associated guanylate kinase, WW and PDZ domain-containing protein 2 isoform X3 [Patella vulgata]|uniref:membrane-associated guanylate kinase, WW and PDZ domain-containing protein 2 isoform X3 n=1 Tax=Patella vulgata TaxID=6465 RepID=UPI0024A90511|nr:membrane-associated guanylate kinase, WW and PDZ domain-containing protein 2 isoform X3 [Patella vulgata]